MIRGTVTSIQRFSLHDGPGIRTTVFMQGCGMKCPWCQNPESKSKLMQPWQDASICLNCNACHQICQSNAVELLEPNSDSRQRVSNASSCDHCYQCVTTCPVRGIKPIAQEYSVRDIVKKLKKDEMFYNHSNGGITLSGGEPLIQSKFAKDLLIECKSLGWSTSLETSLSIPKENLKTVLPFVDFLYCDLKAADADEHLKWTGFSLSHILDNLKHVNEYMHSDNHLEVTVRIPLIPGYTADPKKIKKITQLAFATIPNAKLELMPFNPLAHSKYQKLGEKWDFPTLPLPDELIAECIQAAMESGMNVVEFQKEIVTQDSLQIPTGERTLDRIRAEAIHQCTNIENFEERATALEVWKNLLQQRGVSLASFIPIFNDIQDATKSGHAEALFEAMDKGLQCFESLQIAARELGKAEFSSETEEMQETNQVWPGYGNDASHTASTEHKGPSKGQIAWRRSMGLGWYPQPTIYKNTVIAGCPGMRDQAVAFDLATGKTTWRSKRYRPQAKERLRLAGLHVLPQCYATPCVASTPLFIQEPSSSGASDQMLLAEMGAQGRDNSARDMIFINPDSGEEINRVPAGAIDYRSGWSQVLKYKHFLIYPMGTQKISSNPPQYSGQDRLICFDTKTNIEAWHVQIGFLVIPPIIYKDHLYVGNQKGQLSCLRIYEGDGEDYFGYTDPNRIKWSLSLGASIASSMEISDDTLWVMTSQYKMFCIDTQWGQIKWQKSLLSKESIPGSHVSIICGTKPVLHKDKLYVGTSESQLFCLQADSGELVNQIQLSDWGRAAPLIYNDQVHLISLDANWQVFDLDLNQKLNEQMLSDAYCFSDPIIKEHQAFLIDGQLNLISLNLKDMNIAWSEKILRHAEQDGELLRSDEMAAGAFFQSKPTMADGQVFCGGPSRFVEAVSQKDGALNWRYELTGAVSGSPAWADGKVFIGQQGGSDEFVCIDSTSGKRIWSQQIGWVWSSATTFEGYVYVPGIDGWATCLDAANGNIIWRQRLGMALNPEAPIDNGMVFFGSWDHHVYALDLKTGQQKWQFNTGGTPDSGAPIAKDGKLWIPAGGTRLTCMNTHTGQKIWMYTINKGCLNGSPALWKDRIYISVNQTTGAIPVASQIRCLNALTGEEVWSVPGGGITAPAIADASGQAKLYCASTADTWFRCYDAESGELIWRSRMGERVYESVPTIANERAAILSDDGYLNCFK